MGVSSGTGSGARLVFGWPPLRLDYAQLKKRLGGVVKSPRKAASPAFVELIASHPATVSECVIEFEPTRGGKLRIQWKGSAAPDWQACFVRGGKRSDDSYHGADACACGDRASRRTQGDRFLGSRLPGSAL